MTARLAYFGLVILAILVSAPASAVQNPKVLAGVHYEEIVRARVRRAKRRPF
jgi:hypothetical protein